MCLAQAQNIPGNKAIASFTGLAASGASISIQSNPNLGITKFIGDGNGGTAVHFNLSPLQPKRTRLKLYSGSTMVRDIPGPSPVDILDPRVEQLVHTAELNPGEDWIWPAVALCAYLLSCVDIKHTTTTTTTTTGGVTTTTTTHSVEMGWDCGLGMSTGPVVVDGITYPNINKMVLEVETNGAQGPVSSLGFSAQGGARLTSVR